MDTVARGMLGGLRGRGGRRGSAPDPAERRLIELLHAADPVAIGLVEERFGRLLSGFLAEAMPDPASAEDVKQQVLLEVWRRGPDYDPGRAGLLTWLMTIARSRAIDERRRRRPEPVDPVALDSGAAESEPEVERMLERWRLADLLEQIPREEADALRLRFYDELAQTEIAERIGVPLGTVKTRMVRGLARLRDLIEEAA
jgi:RNA polymerase sigma-70 factor, ECF subfamily